VHEVPSGRLLGKAIVGAHIGATHVYDFDGDGAAELLVGSNAVGNGARAGGFDDSHAYFIMFELTPPISVAWSRQVGERWQLALFQLFDFDSDGKAEVLAITAHHAVGAEQTVLELIEPGSWRTLRRRVFQEPIHSPTVVNMDRDPAPELVAVRAPDEIWLFDDGFDTVRRRRVTTPIQWVTHTFDMDGDGVSELMAGVSGDQLLVMDRLLRPLALVNGTGLNLVARGGMAPLTLLTSADGQVAGTFMRNRLYLVNRYRAETVGGLASSLIIFLFVSIRTVRRRAKFAHAVQSHVWDDASSGALLLDRKGRVVWRTGWFSRWPEAASGRDRLRTLDDVTAHLPELAAFCRQRLMAKPRVPHTASLEQIQDGARRHTRVEMTPLNIGIRGDPHWLVVITAPRDRSGQDPCTWALVADRVASSVRDPLASTLLTLKRLQHEYRGLGLMRTQNLDAYVARIEARIAQIRTVMANFQKFIDAHTAERVPMNISALLSGFVQRLRATLPRDIELQLTLEPDLPPVLGDAAQLDSVLENLVANAMDAMPGGGVLTLATSLVRDVQWTPAAPPRSYVSIDVMDTGHGMSAEVRNRMFEPGFTTAEFRSGLGLAIVRKIVSDHDGHVTVESEPGSGSTFTVHLPVAESTAARSSMPDARETS
jgi:signal transduction histidine kinase